VRHLVGDGFEPGLVCFDEGDHFCEPVGGVSNFSVGCCGTGVILLLSDSRLLNELLAENDALVAPLQTLFDDGSRLADDCTRHHEALVVEVRHWNDR